MADFGGLAAHLGLDARHLVSPTPRAVFAIFTTLLAIACCMALAIFKFPVDVTIANTAIGAIGGLGMSVALAYIGGSVMDYRKLLQTAADKAGFQLPPAILQAIPQGAADGGDLTPDAPAGS